MDNIIINDVDWLRNDYPVNITIAGITYPTAEHAYQAAKFKDKSIKLKIAGLDPSEVKEARRIGRKSVGINPDWDSIREGVMTRILEQKFSNTVLGDRLAKTGNADLVLEGGDDFWGVGKIGCGDNVLGAILGYVREGLQFDRGIEVEEDSKPNLISLSEALNERDQILISLCEELYIQVINALEDPGPAARRARLRNVIEKIDGQLYFLSKDKQNEDEDDCDDLDYDPCG
jgi:ribA/ribD-fused uncharacterized protein